MWYDVHMFMNVHCTCVQTIFHFSQKVSLLQYDVKVSFLEEIAVWSQITKTPGNRNNVDIFAKGPQIKAVFLNKICPKSKMLFLTSYMYIHYIKHCIQYGKIIQNILSMTASIMLQTGHTCIHIISINKDSDS